MAQLNNEQLELMSSINKIRLEIIKEFRQHSNPSSNSLLSSLLKLEVILMENKYKENLEEFLDQNHKNLIALLNNVYVGRNEPKKFKVKWQKQKEQKQTMQKKEQFKVKEQNNSVFVHQNNNKKDPRPENRYQKIMTERAPQVSMLAKVVVPAGEFMSANTLPKSTSIRKKFIPPYKKPEGSLKEISQRQEENEEKTDPIYKNIDQKLVSIIESEILQKGQQVKWSQIAGLGFAKKIIHEMIVWPMLRPDIFTGMRAPPRAILLFGPPGTGKTMIGRAIASQASATFFSISASSLTSKWVGQSQKLVKVLFTLARLRQPSVIFIDEIDSLLSSRSEGEQQSSRRIKTEFLIQLDGAKTNTNQRVLIIGATNLPKELDDAVRRRFVKRLYIPLPNTQGRVQLIKSLTDNTAFNLNQQEIFKLAIKTKGFSGADLYVLCSQSSMIPLREMTSIKDVRQSQVPRSQFKHFQQAFKLVRPSVNKNILKFFQQFNEQYGSYQLSPDQLENESQFNTSQAP